MGILLLLVAAVIGGGAALRQAAQNKGAQNRGAPPPLAWHPYDPRQGFKPGRYRISSIQSATVNFVQNCTDALTNDGFGVQVVYPAGAVNPPDWPAGDDAATRLRFDVVANAELEPMNFGAPASNDPNSAGYLTFGPNQTRVWIWA